MKLTHRLFHHASGGLTHDPIMGDELTPGEAMAWRVQWIIRRWTFLVLITTATAIAWTVVAAAGIADVLTWWNCAASYLALVIEGVVGMAMYHQTQRDAQVIREVRKLTTEIHRYQGRLEALSEEMYDLQLRSEK